MVEIPRRGMIRPISDLPAAPAGASLMEVEIGGQFYKAAPAAGGSSFWALTAMQNTLAVPVGSQAFVDLTGKVLTIVGSVAGVADAGVPGGLCAGFTGAGGEISFNAGDDFQIPNILLAVEGWFSTTQAAQQYTTMIERETGSFNGGSWTLMINADSGNDGKIVFWYSDVSGTNPAAKTTVGGFNDGVRHHVYVAKMGQRVEIWVDGIRRTANTGTSAYSADISGAGTTLRLGNSVNAGRHFIGHMDNWRVIRSAVPYSVSPFTVPTPPFPTT